MYGDQSTAASLEWRRGNRLQRAANAMEERQRKSMVSLKDDGGDPRVESIKKNKSGSTESRQDGSGGKKVLRALASA
jgi:hypothetical protein